MWYLVGDWVEVSRVDPNFIVDYFHHYAFIVTCYGCLIWRERNDKFFNNKLKFMPRMLEKVKYLSIWWLKKNAINVSNWFSGWCRRPLHCLYAG